MEPRPPRGNRPPPTERYEPPTPSPPQQAPPPSAESPTPPPPRPEPRWDQPSTTSYRPEAPPSARPIDPPYRPPASPYGSAAGSAGASSAGTYGSAAAGAPPARAPWYDPAGPGTPGMGVQPPASPPPGVRAGSASGGGWFLRALVAALAVGILLIAAAFAYTRARDDDDDDPNQVAVEQTAVRATELAELAAVRGTPAGTPLPTATAEPTVTPTVAASPTAADEAAAREESEEGGGSASAEEDATEEENESTAPRRTRLPVSEMIPAENEAPSGFIVDVETDGRFSFNEVATSLGAIEEATTLLEEWDWQEGLFRAFKPPAGAAPPPNETNYFYVSIHRFGTEEGAVEALDYFADTKASSGLAEIEADPLGDEMRALSNAGGDSAAEVDLYIRDGTRVIRIATFSDAGDPLADAIAFAEQVLGIA